MEDNLSEKKKLMSEIFKDMTQIYSEISRNIVFALIALIWAISYADAKLVLHLDSALTILSLVSFLFIDLLQYFLTSYSYRKLFEKTKNPNFTEHELDNSKKRIDNRSVFLLYTKSGALAISFVLVFITVIRKANF